ncbi:MAG TPA: hypothetical protein VGF67_32275 [Ktedonobacteraceae bacterium]
MSRIRQISIKNLFGIFNHDIALHMERRVTIAHGPNGSGKTATIKLLKELFTQGTTALGNIPFDEFHIYFEDQWHLQVTQKLTETHFPPRSAQSTRGRKIMCQLVFSYAHPRTEAEVVARLELTEDDEPDIYTNRHPPTGTDLSPTDARCWHVFSSRFFPAIYRARGKRSTKKGTDLA